MRAGRHTRAAGAAALVVLTAACGSTARLPVAQPGESNQAAPVDNGLEIPRAAAPPASADSSASTIASSPMGAAAPIQGGSPAPRATSRSQSVSPAARPRLGGPPIRIGLAYQRDVGPYAAALGFDVNPGDYRGAAEALVDDINRSGGVLGRKLELAAKEDNTASSAAQPAVAAQSMCEELTTDDHVDVAISAVNAINTPTFFKCLAERQTPVVILDPNPHSLRSEFEAYSPYVYHPASVAIERLTPIWIDRLAGQGWLGRWDTSAGQPGTAPVQVAIVHQQNETFARSLSRDLARHGVAAPLELTYTGIENAAANMRTFVVQMKGRGVTHVFVDKAITTMLMTIEAEDQEYRPRYGLSTFNGPTPGLARQRAVPKEQLRGSAGVGFVPLADVADSRPFVGTGSPARRCEAIASAAGVVAQTDLARLYQHLVCDALWQLVESWRVAGGVDARSLQLGMEARAGTRAASTLVTRFGPGKHDGAGAVRDFAWNVDCTCFRYGRTQTPT